MFDYTRQPQRQLAQPTMGPDFAGTPTPMMPQSDLINSVMAATAAKKQQGGGGAGLGMLGTALAGLGGNKGLGPAVPDHMQPAQPDTPEMLHGGAGPMQPTLPAHNFGGGGGGFDDGDFMSPRKRQPFNGLGAPMDMAQLFA